MAKQLKIKLQATPVEITPETAQNVSLLLEIAIAYVKTLPKPVQQKTISLKAVQDVEVWRKGLVRKTGK